LLTNILREINHLIKKYYNSEILKKIISKVAVDEYLVALKCVALIIQIIHRKKYMGKTILLKDLKF